MRRPHLERDQNVCQGNQPTNLAMVADWSVEETTPELTDAAAVMDSDVSPREQSNGLQQ
jgi:hypothetical protein